MALNAIWKASDPTCTDPTSWKKLPASGLVIWWWITFLAYAFGKRFYSHISEAPQWTAKIEDVLYLSWVALGIDLFSIVPEVLAILMVVEIQHRQEEKYKALAGAPP